MFEIPMRREQSFGYSALFLKEYSCYFKLCIDTKSNPILFPQTKRQQTLRYFQDFVGNSAEDGRFTVLMQIDVEILPLQREPTPPQRRVHARWTMIFSPQVLGNSNIFVRENIPTWTLLKGEKPSFSVKAWSNISLRDLMKMLRKEWTKKFYGSLNDKPCWILFVSSDRSSCSRPLTTFSHNLLSLLKISL